ncbi:hypothetical protein NDU88_006045 [Pleurodeles waltl]|uniref:Uncharacterized protein n=1 Tax=Pleurodeles waltl TaxID=8319 RepID=A0AAV7WDP0_PLEWA|nr:hypothetical protein NDU88_006045 [Pleurodeles waltl]
MARSTVLDRPDPPCIKEEANPASVRRIAATMEYCVLPQRSRADCGVTAGNNAELPSESDAAALSMNEVGLCGEESVSCKEYADCSAPFRPSRTCSTVGPVFFRVDCILPRPFLRD